MRMLSQEELDKLFNVVKKPPLPPVTEMKPSEIDELTGYDRIDYKIQFNKSLRIYVKPLEKLVKDLLNNANKEKYNYDVDDLAIRERIVLFNSILIRSGYTKEHLTSLLPNTEEDVDLLVKAFENGFKDFEVLNNEMRIQEAKKFLKNIEKNNSGRRIF